MWRKGYAQALLVSVQIGAATVKNSMQAIQKFQNNTALQPRYSTSECISEEIQNTSLKRDMHPMLIAALSTVAKLWKQP